MRKRLSLVLALGLTISGFSQVTLTPTFVTQNDTVTVTFDATQGNAALVGVSQVYAHTGVITNLSTSATDWRHVQGTWGTDDARMKMTNIGNNQHTLKYHINSFYSVPSNETVSALAFVFRDQAGNTVGRASDGSDIFVPIYTSAFAAAIISPSDPNLLLEQTDSVELEGQASQSAALDFLVDGNSVATTNGNVLNHTLQLNTLSPGLHTIVFSADNGSTTIYDTLEITIRTMTPTGSKPSWGKPGITWRNDSLYLELRAPGKEYVYVIGDFNDWKLDEPYQMTKTPNDSVFWIILDNLTPGQPVKFQYHVGADAIRVADPYSRVVLDPWNDPWIHDSTYANVPDYPVGKASNIVSYSDPNPAQYTWDNSYTYQRPDQEELVIYELLIRDFREGHSYNSVIEKLDYLQNLGVNTIELMPIMEFEGNESWGYNPSFFFAVDKYYGETNELKRFVDSCHKRGIAVILDIVLNHAFGQNPMVRMYWDGANNRPAANSPWFNPIPKHDFNVGYDFNHESFDTRKFCRDVLTYWMEEFQVDGYRMDLSKGLTQKNTLGNVGLWGQYDQTRVDILTDYANTVWSVDPGAYFTLEHFADISEETALANGGMMLWGNENHQYNEGSMGYPSNFFGVTHKSRGWADMHLIGYMESHDEERLMYRNINFGNRNVNYTTREIDTALQRVALASTFFYTLPGPKMLWMFGEVGYDYSIDYNGRVGNKPIRWDYFQDSNRRALYNHFAILNELRSQHEIFRKDGNLQLGLSAYTKRIGLSDANMNVIILGNFNIVDATINPQFSQTGMWYEFFTNDSLNVTDIDSILSLKPGEYRLYSDVRLRPAPMEPGDTSEPADTPTTNQVRVFPTIADENGVHFEIETVTNDFVEIYIYDLQGNQIWDYTSYGMTESIRDVIWKGTTNAGNYVSNGVYVYRIQRLGGVTEGKLVLLR